MTLVQRFNPTPIVRYSNRALRGEGGRLTAGECGLLYGVPVLGFAAAAAARLHPGAELLIVTRVMGVIDAVNRPVLEPAPPR